MRCCIVGLGLLLGVLVACETSIRTHYDLDREARFADYRTFAWVTNEPLIQPAMGMAETDPRVGPLVEQSIRRAVERHLTAKGYQKRAEPGGADLALSFSLGTRQKIQVDSYPAHAGYRYGPYHGGARWYSDVRTYQEGTLALDFFDVKTRQAVWHGWAEKRLSTTAPEPAKRDAMIDEAVGKILQPFPARTP